MGQEDRANRPPPQPPAAGWSPPGDSQGPGAYAPAQQAPQFPPPLPEGMRPQGPAPGLVNQWTPPTPPPGTQDKGGISVGSWVIAGVAALVVMAVFAMFVIQVAEDQAESTLGYPTSAEEDYFDPYPYGVGFEDDWETHQAGTEPTTIEWRMPAATGVDGPRELANIAAPAIGTWWVNLDTDGALRYDGMLLENLGALGSNHAEVLEQALEAINGPESTSMDMPIEFAGSAEVYFEQESHERTYLGYAWAWNDSVFAVSVGYPLGRDELRDEAEWKLDTMLSYVTFRSN